MLCVRADVASERVEDGARLVRAFADCDWAFDGAAGERLGELFDLTGDTVNATLCTMQLLDPAASSALILEDAPTGSLVRTLERLERLQPGGTVDIEATRRFLRAVLAKLDQ